MNILMKVTLGKIMICYETTLLPHLFSFKHFLLRSPSQWIETLCAFQNGHFLMFCFLCFIVKQIIHKSYVLVHFVIPEYCCCCQWTSFLRKSKFSQFLSPKKFGTLKIANMQNLCSGVYMMTSWSEKNFQATDTLWSYPLVTGGFPSQRASKMELDVVCIC